MSSGGVVFRPVCRLLVMMMMMMMAVMMMMMMMMMIRGTTQCDVMIRLSAV